MNTRDSKSALTVPITILLSKQHRNVAGIAKLIEIVSKLEMEVTSSGNASICCNVTRPHFIQLFGIPPRELEARPQGKSDFGSPTGFYCQELAVPPMLKGMVDVISIEPPSIRLDEQ